MAEAVIDRNDGEGLDFGSKLVVLIAGVVASLAIVAIASILPQIDHALAHNATESLMVKQLVGVVGLAMVFGSAIVGFLVDRYPISRIVLIAAVIYTIAGTAGFYLSDLRMLLVSRLFVGLTSAAIQVSSMTLISKRLTGVRRAHWMGLHIFVAMATGILGHPLAGLLGESNWRYAFLLYGLGVLLIPAALFQKDHLAGDRLAARNRALAPRSPGGWSWFPFHYLLLALCIGSVLYMPTVHVPFLMREKGMVRPAMIALVLTADALAGSLMALTFGRVRRYISSHAAYLISFGMGAIGMAIAATAPTIPGVIAGLFVYGIGSGWFVPNLMSSLAAKLTPECQGRAAGLVKGAHFLSAPLSIAAVDPIARMYGHGAAILSGAAICLVCFVAMGLRTLAQSGRPAAVAEQAA